MKFSKRIQSQQFSEWSTHYLDYKGLKKFIGVLLASEEAKKASFFFKLSFEFEKINSFYFQKENDAKVRLKTLLDKKKLIQLDSNRLKHSSAQLDSLNEAFTQFERDLNKLQKYVELNNEGFQKILKKWDKRSKSKTKELYLSRQIDIQPCFNTQILTELADASSTSRIKISDLIKMTNKSPTIPNSPKPNYTQTDDIELDLLRAIASNQPLLVKMELSRMPPTWIVDDKNRISRTFFQACCSTECSIEIIQLLINTGMVHFAYVDDINERSCLHVVAMNGRLDILELVFSNKQRPDVNQRDIYGRTPLHYATMKGFDGCVSFLLDQHADIEFLLSGDYSHIVVQLTRDRVPVVFSSWMIPFDGLDLAVSDLTYHQLYQLAIKTASQRGSYDYTGNGDLVKKLKNQNSILTLAQVLQRLPTTMGVLLEIKYPNIDELDIHPFSNILDKNSYVDIILQCIYDHVRSLSLDVPSTRIVFTSFNPTICTIVNWKQPNYAVFFSTCCRINKGEQKYKSIGNPQINVFLRLYSNAVKTSLKEAVKFAKRNNLLGIISDATTLVQIPSLISNIKESGLVLVTFGDMNRNIECIETQNRLGVDANLIHGVVHFNTEMAGLIK